MATALEAHCWGLVILAHCLLTSYLGKFLSLILMHTFFTCETKMVAERLASLKTRQKILGHGM